MAQDGHSHNTNMQRHAQQSSSKCNSSSAPTSSRKRRNSAGTPGPDAEVVALSPRALLATNSFFCETCNKGFNREQNLQLHRRGHNLPWKLKQRANNEPLKKKVYVCPDPDCVHHDPSRALGDLTGIKKHFGRKHGEKKWECEKCNKGYAVYSDWKAHAKICGTRKYSCDCGTVFSRKDSYIAHRVFCAALAQGNVTFEEIAGLANEVMSGRKLGPKSQATATATTSAEMESVEYLNFDGHNTNNQQLQLVQSGQEYSGSIYLNSNFNAFLPSQSCTNFPESTLSMQMKNLIGSSSADQQFKNADTSLSLGQRHVDDNTGNWHTNLKYFNGIANYGLPAQVNDSSATRLLLQAAQMGSTASLLGYNAGSLGLMSNSSQVNNTLDLNTSLEDASYDFFGHGNHTRIDLNKDVGTMSSENYSMGVQFLADPSESLFPQGSNNVMMPRVGEVYHANQFQADTRNAVAEALTRDFLGVGSGRTRPPLHKEFGSMGLGLDLNK